MRIAYFCCDLDARNIYNPAGSTHSNGIVYGLEKVSDSDLDVFSLPVIPRFPKSKMLLSPTGCFKIDRRSMARHIPFINLLFIKQLSIFITTFLLFLGWSWRYRKEKEKVVMICYLATYFVLPVYIVSKIMSIHFVPQISDPYIPCIELRGWKRIADNIDKRISNWILKHVSYGLTLTQKLGEDFLPNASYHVYTCGVYPEQISEPASCTLADKHVVIYSGVLATIYMISLVLESFRLLDPEEFELHIYGGGEMCEQVKEAQRHYNHIKYMGIVPKNELVIHQKNASLLLSLKNPKDTLVPYTFSSKLLEYLASGTPVLCTNTHDAQTFRELIFVTKELTPQAVAEDIKHACALSPEQRKLRSKKANHLLEEKYTWERIGADIFDFLKEIFSKGDAIKDCGK